MLDVPFAHLEIFHLKDKLTKAFSACIQYILSWIPNPKMEPIQFNKEFLPKQKFLTSGFNHFRDMQSTEYVQYCLSSWPYLQVPAQPIETEHNKTPPTLEGKQLISLH